MQITTRNENANKRFCRRLFASEGYRTPLSGHRHSGSVLTSLVILLFVAALATGGAFLAAQSLTKDSGTGSPPESEHRTPDKSGYEYVPFGTVVANLSEERLTRYLKATITLKVSKQGVAPLQQMLEGNRKAIFQDWLLLYLSDRQMDEVRGAAAVAKLQSDIQDGFNSILAEHGNVRVEDILFTELNIQ